MSFRGVIGAYRLVRLDCSSSVQCFIHPKTGDIKYGMPVANTLKEHVIILCIRVRLMISLI